MSHTVTRARQRQRRHAGGWHRRGAADVIESPLFRGRPALSSLAAQFTFKADLRGLKRFIFCIFVSVHFEKPLEKKHNLLHVALLVPGKTHLISSGIGQG